MARPAHRMEDEYDGVLSRYLRGLARQGSPARMAPAPGHQIRTCPACGERASFALDAEGTWSRCGRCGSYA